MSGDEQALRAAPNVPEQLAGSPRSFSLSRSFSVKAVPLLSVGSFNSHTPVGRRPRRCLLIASPLSPLPVRLPLQPHPLTAGQSGLHVGQTPDLQPERHEKCENEQRRDRQTAPPDLRVPHRRIARVVGAARGR